MEKFFELFGHNIKTERLEMRILEPNEENAQLVWNVLKNENPDDFIYSSRLESILPISQEDTLNVMQYYQARCQNRGIAWFLFYNNELIGYQRIYYCPDNKTLECSSVWFARKYWGNGFNQEIHRKIEEIAFEQLGVNRICRQCIKDNIRSYNSIIKSGYHLDGINRQYLLTPDGIYHDECFFTKLAREYTEQKSHITKSNI